MASRGGFGPAWLKRGSQAGGAVGEGWPPRSASAQMYNSPAKAPWSSVRALEARPRPADPGTINPIAMAMPSERLAVRFRSEPRQVRIAGIELHPDPRRECAISPPINSTSAAMLDRESQHKVCGPHDGSRTPQPTTTGVPAENP